MLMSKDGVHNSLPKNTFTMPAYVKRGKSHVIIMSSDMILVVNFKILTNLLFYLYVFFVIDIHFKLDSVDYLGVGALQDINTQQTISLWNVEAMLRIKINCAMYVNVRERGDVSLNQHL